MSIVNEKMTALADEIRELSDTTTTKSLDAMASDINAANTEISEQMELIAQISTALENKAVGSGGNVEYEIVNLTSSSASIPFTLKRITATYGMNTENGECRLLNVAHQNTRAISVQGDGTQAPRASFLRDLFFSNSSLQSGTEFFAPYTAVFINDPSQPALYEATT